MTKKNLYLLTIITFLLLIFLYSNFHKKSSSKINYDYSIKTEEGKPITVARVIDGDTIELINEERLRYIGIDTPEEVNPRKPVQCYAKEAATKNQQLVEGKKIIFYKDISVRDKYGRWLGFVYLEDGTFVNLELTKQGFAFAYPYVPDTSKKREFKEAEKQAAEKNLGLWSHCQVHKTSYGRKQTNTI
ncbi:thermonuclease family protein [Candidatus Peregrinibacteria bacterium]|nr:thermonuclease family protein [Candidatus Peregrinibacteria bacterium]